MPAFSLRRYLPFDAVILAAGRSANFEAPPPLLSLGRECILGRLARQVRRAGAREIIVVIGFRGDELRREVARSARGVRFIENPDWERTRTAASLRLGLAAARSPLTLVLDGDLVLEDRILRRILASPPRAIAMDSEKILGWLDDKVAVDGDRVKRIGKDVDSPAGESLGAALIDLEARRALLPLLKGNGWYEEAFNAIIRRMRFEAVDVAGGKWQEVDFAGDYDDALRIFGGRVGKRLAEARRRGSTRRLLFCPGPVLISDDVRAAASSVVIGHHEPEFSNLLASVRKKLLRVARAPSGFSAVVLPGSGTSANESLLAALTRGQKLLALSNGEFGERLRALAEFQGHRLAALRLPWGAPLTPSAVERALKRHRPAHLLMVHHETSTGTLNDVETISRLAKKCGASVILDTVSSFGGVRVPTEAVDFLTGSANKCIGALPGLAFVIGRTSAFRAMEPSRLWTLDLRRHFDFQEKFGQTPHTPPVSLVAALSAALDEVIAEGEGRFERLRGLADRLRRGVSSLGFSVAPGCDSPLLTNFLLPRGVRFEKLQGFLKSEGFVVYSGKGPLEGRIVQIANMGGVTERDADELIRAFRRFRRQEAWPRRRGRGRPAPPEGAAVQRQ